MTSISIKNVTDKRSRALLRGLLDHTPRSSDTKKVFPKLLRHVNRRDLPLLDELLRTDYLFRHIKISPEFPAIVPFQGDQGAAILPSDELVLEHIAYRILRNEDQICAALRLFADLNSAIWQLNDDGIVRAIGNITTQVGHSLTLVRKAAFVVGYAEKTTLSYLTCSELLSTYGIDGKNYGIMATIDSIASDFNYLDLKYSFREYANADRENSLPRKISHLSFFPLAYEENAFVKSISASYQISLVDAVIAMLVHRDLGILNGIPPVSHEIDQAWRALTAAVIGPTTYFSSRNPHSDQAAFRAAPAFLEYHAFRHVRRSFEALYDVPQLRSDWGSEARNYAQGFFQPVQSIMDLVPREGTGTFDALPASFQQGDAGALARTCGIVLVCGRGADFSQVTPEAMASLMGRTFEVDRLITTENLRRAAQSASDPFVKLILHTLLRAHSSATKDSYNFKEQFQSYVRGHHEGKILDFMAAVYSLSEDIIQYFVNLLDETLLSQMAFLMESSNSIYETRARLLEWYADRTGDRSTRDKARQLRLDRKIAEVRGAINEARLNIDSVRFRQWIEQDKLKEFSDFIRQGGPALPRLSDLTDMAKAQTTFLSAHREPSKRALQALIECYEVFCKNPDFGIASFLGRRIRHGTLRGTLLNGLPDPFGGEIPPNAVGQYQTWYREYSNSINGLAAHLYFRDKASHKNGMISPEVDSTQKWQSCLTCLQDIFEQAQHDHGIAIVPLLIEQYCWLIFETELTNVRAAISDSRGKWGTLKLRYTPSNHDVIVFERETNITLENHFNTVISWFRKPPNISPVAELGHVIQVALKEAADEYHSFCPQVDFAGAKDLKLSGAIYYFVYDALNIAIRNAAKHGDHPGVIGVHAEVSGAEAAKLLEISVTSRTKPTDKLNEVIERIEEIGREGATGADTFEGLSGIRKLEKMKVERKILGYIAKPGDGEGRVLQLSILLPFTGLVE